MNGPQGGTWTINLAAGTVARDGATGDLIVTATSGGFTDLLRGQLDFAAARAAGTFSYTGDASLFTTLAAFLKEGA